MTNYDKCKKFRDFKNRIYAIGLTSPQWEIIIAAVAEVLDL